MKPRQKSKHRPPQIQPKHDHHDHHDHHHRGSVHDKDKKIDSARYHQDRMVHLFRANLNQVGIENEFAPYIDSESEGSFKAKRKPFKMVEWLVVVANLVHIVSFSILATAWQIIKHSRPDSHFNQLVIDTDQVYCPHCHTEVSPIKDTNPTIWTHVIAAVLYIFMCVPFVYLPYVFNCFGKPINRCPLCDEFLGDTVFKPLSSSSSDSATSRVK